MDATQTTQIQETWHLTREMIESLSRVLEELDWRFELKLTQGDIDQDLDFGRRRAPGRG